MNIRYEIVRMFCMLIVFIPIYAIGFKKIGGYSWKVAIKSTLYTVILFIVFDSLCRYFGLFNY
ncbi:hypothetical protein BM1374166_02153 [Bartonella tribocorum]|nr:hypothetical protein BM1374166_02153 [Bartonella tribocorum]